jgi:hypothetical protein
MQPGIESLGLIERAAPGIADEGERPVMPVGRLTIQPSYAPMFRLEKV